MKLLCYLFYMLFILFTISIRKDMKNNIQIFIIFYNRNKRCSHNRDKCIIDIITKMFFHIIIRKTSIFFC